MASPRQFSTRVSTTSTDQLNDFIFRASVGTCRAIFTIPRDIYYASNRRTTPVSRNTAASIPGESTRRQPYSFLTLKDSLTQKRPLKSAVGFDGKLDTHFDGKSIVAKGPRNPRLRLQVHGKNLKLMGGTETDSIYIFISRPSSEIGIHILTTKDFYFAFASDHSTARYPRFKIGNLRDIVDLKQDQHLDSTRSAPPHPKLVNNELGL